MTTSLKFIVRPGASRKPEYPAFIPVTFEVIGGYATEPVIITPTKTEIRNLIEDIMIHLLRNDATRGTNLTTDFRKMLIDALELNTTDAMPIPPVYYAVNRRTM